MSHMENMKRDKTREANIQEEVENKEDVANLGLHEEAILVSLHKVSLIIHVGVVKSMDIDLLNAGVEKVTIIIIKEIMLNLLKIMKTLRKPY